MKTSNHPQWALDQRKPGTELRLIRGIYYLYEYKTIYDKSKKKPKKVSGKLLGRVTESGLIPSGKRLLEKSIEKSVIEKPLCKEYGVSLLVSQLFIKYIRALQLSMPDHWKQLLAIAYCRFIYRCPLKNIPFRLSQSYLYELFGIPKFNDKTASAVLNAVGGKQGQMLSYMKTFIASDKYLLMDLTHVFSNSNLMTLSRKGYNNQTNFDPQFNLIYLYSAKSRMPVYYRILPGNIREVKAFKNCLMEAELEDAVIVADKGFYSNINIELLQKEGLRFILPLKRDNPIIDYSLIDSNTFKENDAYFEHEKRIIWYRKFNYGDLAVFLFLDDSLKLKEEKDYLHRVETHPEQYSLKDYHKKRNTFGTIALITDFKRKPGVDVFETYKSRMTIELLFDGMKNVMEADHNYMQNEQTLGGWMFVNHLTLQWYQHLYIELKAKKLLKIYSVNDYIQLLTDLNQLLTDLKKIKINENWYFNEITNQSHKMIEKIGISLDGYNT
ncbi:MAG: transposase [Bacteroidetes bacterium]|nr:transposase [Bacteroidota bacterium]